MGAKFPGVELVGPALPDGHTRATSLAWRQQQAAKRETMKSLHCDSQRGEAGGR